MKGGDAPGGGEAVRVWATEGRAGCEVLPCTNFTSVEDGLAVAPEIGWAQRTNVALYPATVGGTVCK